MTARVAPVRRAVRLAVRRVLRRTVRLTTGLAAALAATGLAACGGDGGGGDPPATTPAPTVPAPAPPPGQQVVLRLASSLVPASGAPVRVTEGGGFYAEVRVLGLSPGSELFGKEADFELSVTTDAPADQLRVPFAVRPRFAQIKLNGLAKLLIEALPDARTGEADAAYEIRLGPPASGLPAGMTLDDAPLRVVVVDSPPVRCGGLEFAARHRGSETSLTRSAEVTLSSPHPDASVSIVHPYKSKFSSSIGDFPPENSLFTTGFATTGNGPGFRATIPFRWLQFFRVELDARLPGCPPITARCDTGCSVR